MHELSLLESVREIIESHAQSHHFSRVTQVTLEIGKLSCVEQEALRFGFDIVMQGTLAESANLIISEKEGLGLCRQCGQHTGMAALYDPCRHCGSPSVEIVEGMELKVKELLVT